MKTLVASLLAAIVAAWATLASAQSPDVFPATPRPRPVYTLTLDGRSACVIPKHRGQSRAEGGQIDVNSLSTSSLTATLSGSVAANAYVGCPGYATERCELIQEFTITCSDPSVKTVKMSIDSVLAGFARSNHRATAGARLATAKVCPVGSPEPAIVITHPTLAVEGRDGRHCNQHLPTLEAPGLPLGHYVLTAELILEAEASGFIAAHAQADFSPSGSLPSDWVRTRDPFQGVDKKNFGFSLTLTASPEDSPATSQRIPASTEIRQASLQATSQKASPPRQFPINEKGFARVFRP